MLGTNPEQRDKTYPEVIQQRDNAWEAEERRALAKGTLQLSGRIGNTVPVSSLSGWLPPNH